MRDYKLKDFEKNTKVKIKLEVEKELSELKEFLTEEEFEKALLEEVDYRYSLLNDDFAFIEDMTKSLEFLVEMLENYRND